MDLNDDDEVGTMLALWLGVRRNKVRKEVVEEDFETDSGETSSWEEFDATVRSYLSGLDLQILGRTSGKEDVILRGLVLVSLVEMGSCGYFQARELFRSTTDHPEEFLETVVGVAVHQICE